MDMSSASLWLHQGLRDPVELKHPKTNSLWGHRWRAPAHAAPPRRCWHSAAKTEPVCMELGVCKGGRGRKANKAGNTAPSVAVENSDEWKWKRRGMLDLVKSLFFAFIPLMLWEFQVRKQICILTGRSRKQLRSSTSCRKGPASCDLHRVSKFLPFAPNPQKKLAREKEKRKK